MKMCIRDRGGNGSGLIVTVDGHRLPLLKHFSETLRECLGCFSYHLSREHVTYSVLYYLALLVSIITGKLREILKAQTYRYLVASCSGNAVSYTHLDVYKRQDYVFGVYLFEDSVGQYICLEYIVNNVSDIEDSLKSIDEQVIAGKYIVKGTDIILQTFFPVLFEETFFERQVNNSMSVLQRMIHICRH